MEQLNTQSPVKTLSADLESIAKKLGTDAAQAANDASEILDSYPGQQQALLLIMSALRLMNEKEAARELLEWMSEKNPRLASIDYELGLLLAGEGQTDKAIERFSRVVELEPNHPSAWRALGNQLALTGDAAGAGKAFARQLRLSAVELRLLEDATAAKAEELIKAENMLRESLAVNPTDVSMMRMLANVYGRLGRLRECANLLERALRLAPEYNDARKDYAIVLSQIMKWDEANAELDTLLKTEPDDPHYTSMKAANLVLLGEYDQALKLYDKARAKLSGDRAFWVGYGNAVRTIGRSADAIEAYRESIKCDPGFGTAWYALANLKTYRFSAAEIETMRTQIVRDDIPDGDRCLLEFSLGQAFEDEGDYPASFEHYRAGNALRRPYVHYNADDETARMKAAKAFFTPEFFRPREGFGCPAPDPIFIVGMVRAGSTLIEQILSSHSAVEGTMELPDLFDAISDLKKRHEPKPYPQLLATVDKDEWRALGEQYLQSSRSQRKLARPFFTDKTGMNYVHIGVIHLILPNAKIIDARRHPLSCCFSSYKQAFSANSTPYSYDLTEDGRNYRDYVEMMEHFDKVLPGRALRVFHEDMVRDSETQIRRILDFCGLPFEESCLRFYETQRGVRTVSSEQVRKPIYAKKVETWQHYEPWIGPLKDALGEVLDIYPQVPKFE
jgi:tetratricopeptide (TPR) repeat protein